MGVNGSGSHKNSFLHCFLHFNLITIAITNLAPNWCMQTIIVAPVKTANRPFPDSRGRDSISVNPVQPLVVQAFIGHVPVSHESAAADGEPRYIPRATG